MIKRYGTYCIISSVHVKELPTAEDIQTGLRTFMNEIMDAVMEQYQGDVEAIVPAYYNDQRITYAFINANKPIITFRGSWARVCPFVQSMWRNCRVGCVGDYAVVQYDLSHILKHGTPELLNVVLDDIRDNFQDWTHPDPEVMVSGILFKKG